MQKVANQAAAVERSRSTWRKARWHRKHVPKRIKPRGQANLESQLRQLREQSEQRE